MRLRLLLLTCSALALGAPAVASATDYCVAPAGGCLPADTYPQSASGLQAALDAAALASGSRVILGAATYTAAAAFTYNHPTVPVEIVGQGQGVTILDAPTNTDTFRFSGGPLSVIHDLTIRAGLYAGPAGFPIALSLASTAEHVAIAGDPDTTGAIGVYLRGGTFADGTVTLPTSGSISAVNSGEDGGVVRDSVLVGRVGLNMNQSGFRGQRLHISGPAPAEFRGTDNVLDDSLLEVADGGVGVYAGDGNGQDPDVALRHDTIVGTGTGTGLYASSANTGHVVSITASSAIIRGFAHDRYVFAGGADTHATVTTSYSDYDPAGDIANAASGGSASLSAFPGTGDINVTPGFAGPGVDFRLGAASPLVDAGDPAGLAVAESATDLTGERRILDGDSDCAARSDIGAYERRPGGPVAKAAASGSPVAGGGSATFDAAGSCDDDPAHAPDYAWSFDDGAGATGAIVQHVFATAGTHHATLTVTDAIGHTATAQASIEVAAGPQPPAGGVPPAAHAPVLDRLGVTPAPVSAAKAKRARVRFRLDVGASVRLTLARRAAGRRRGSRCVKLAAGAPAPARARRCTRWVTIGSRTVQGAAGTTAVKLPAARLAAGRYALSAVATTPAGLHSAPRTVRFAVVA